MATHSFPEVKLMAEEGTIKAYNKIIERGGIVTSDRNINNLESNIGQLFAPQMPTSLLPVRRIENVSSPLYISSMSSSTQFYRIDIDRSIDYLLTMNPMTGELYHRSSEDGEDWSLGKYVPIMKVYVQEVQAPYIPIPMVGEGLIVAYLSVYKGDGYVEFRLSDKDGVPIELQSSRSYMIKKDPYIMYSSDDWFYDVFYNEISINAFGLQDIGNSYPLYRVFDAVEPVDDPHHMEVTTYCPLVMNVEIFEREFMSGNYNYYTFQNTPFIIPDTSAGYIKFPNEAIEINNTFFAELNQNPVNYLWLF